MVAPDTIITNRFTIVFLLFLSLLAGGIETAAAQDANRLEAFLASVKKHSESVSSLSCKLTQERHLAMFSRPVLFQGRLAIVRPKKLRWQFTEPIPSTLLFSGSRGMRCQEGSEPVSFDLESDPVMKVVAEQLWTWLSSDYSGLQDKYNLEFESDSTLIVTPREVGFSQTIDRILIRFHPDHGQPERVEILEQGGDKTILLFHDFIFDEHLPETLFTSCRD
ncbi:MAG: outer membrane lipoprotein carrier protein LolA [Thermodesulfobacteriota bacterium]